MRVSVSRIVPAALLLSGLVLAALSMPASAAVQACTEFHFTDPPTDVTTSPSGVPASVTGFDRLEITDVCVTETADSLHVVVDVAAAIASNAVQSYDWTLRFTSTNATSGNATQVQRVFAHANNAGSSTPAGTSEFSSDKIQFNLPRTEFPFRTSFTEISVTASGTFVDQAGGVVTGSDRAPESGGGPLNYTAGQGAPPGQDTDADGTPDRDEIANGTNPESGDTDQDGLNDTEEAELGTDPTLADSDGDGLTDEQEVNQYGTLPDDSDSDDDGLQDHEEVTGATNTFGPNTTTDALDADSDDDGLSDGAEVRELFTDPNDNDTDNDGLSDWQELNRKFTRDPGIQRDFPEGFTATDPTKSDSDGDGYNDYQEVYQGFDPNDSESMPRTADPAQKEEVATYLPLSGAALVIIVLLCLVGIVWRWG